MVCVLTGEILRFETPRFKQTKSHTTKRKLMLKIKELENGTWELSLMGAKRVFGNYEDLELFILDNTGLKIEEL